MTVFVSFSGGLDSTALLHRAVRVYGAEHVVAISFDYGQRHVRELTAAAEVANALGVERRTISLRGLLSGSALLFEADVPHGHYAEENMNATVVGGRNMLFVSVAVAQASPGDAVMLGVHAGDHPIYPDCRPEFVEAIAQAALSAYDVLILAPWVNLSKDGIVSAEPNAPYGLSWSCYEGGEVHCGRCGTCVERAEAFHLANLPDPTSYRDSTFWQEAVR